jgi:hypothetical protein
MGYPAGGFGVGDDPNFCADVVADVYVFPFSDVYTPEKVSLWSIFSTRCID